jgi:hypothetical protein
MTLRVSTDIIYLKTSVNEKTPDPVFYVILKITIRIGKCIKFCLNTIEVKGEMVMSKVKELYEKVAADAALQAKFAEIMKDAEQTGWDTTSIKLIGFAKDAGYDVTVGEMREFFKEKTESNQGVLSDAELDMVAGGKSGEAVDHIFLSIVTLGTLCAAGSIVAELSHPGDCGRLFQ